MFRRRLALTVAGWAALFAAGFVAAWWIIDPAAAPLASPPPAARVDEPARAALDDCGALLSGGRYAEALRRLDTIYPSTREGDAELANLRAEANRRVDGHVDACVAAAEALVAEGEPQRAVDRLADVAALGIRDRLQGAYDRLRQAVYRRRAESRRQSEAETRREIEVLRARYAGSPRALAPRVRMIEAVDMMERRRWRDALAALNEIVGDPALREDALRRRAVTHFALEQYAGLLLDAEEMGAGRLDPHVMSLLAMAALRAPIDEAVVSLYERSLRDRPSQPLVWQNLIQMRAWRHDIEQLTEAIDTASRHGFRAHGGDAHWRTAIAQWKPGMRPDSPIYVDFSDEYEILTDTSPRRAREVVNLIASIAREHARAIPTHRNPNIRFRIVFFARKRDFDDYQRAFRPSAGHEAIAYYSPNLKELVAYEGPPDTPQILRHETFHQILDCVAPHSPPWFHEGMAAFHELSSHERPVFNVKWHMAAQQELDRLPPLRELLTMPFDRFQSDPRMPYFYGQAWSFIYFLHRRRRADLLVRYRELMSLGLRPEAAYGEVFAPLLAEMEPLWREAVRRNKYDP